METTHSHTTRTTTLTELIRHQIDNPTPEAVLRERLMDYLWDWTDCTLDQIEEAKCIPYDTLNMWVRQPNPPFQRLKTMNPR